MKVLDLSKYILSKCTMDFCPISNLQLQKILYYLQEFSLVNLGKPLFDEKIEAWMFGPVVKVVYDEYKSYGSNEIIFLADVDFSSLGDTTFELKKAIDNIIEEKRAKNIWDIIADLHKPGGPWDKIYKNGLGAKKEIPTNLIRKRS